MGGREVRAAASGSMYDCRPNALPRARCANSRRYSTFLEPSPKNLSGHMSDRGHMCGRARPLASHTRGRFGKSYQSSCQHKEFVGGAQAPYLRVPLADGTLVATPELSRDAIARKPITGIVGCCARAASGHAAAAPPSSVMNLRLFIRSPRRRWRAAAAALRGRAPWPYAG